MQEILSNVTELTGLPTETLLLSAIAVSVFFLVYGISSAFAGPTAEQRRLRAATQVGKPMGGAFDVVRLDDNDPTGILRAFVPRSQKERSDIATRLRRGGVHHPNAVLMYYITKLIFSLTLPAIFLAIMFAPDWVNLPHFVRDYLNSLTWMQTFSVLALLVLVGFFIPVLWLKSRIEERAKAIERGLPNALDLMTVALESGLGFDAAMTRVAREMSSVTPEISQEFTILQLELQAGKARAQAFRDMANRCNVNEINSFANVVLQSIQYGTSVGHALITYAREMRMTRELKAQEKANKLPVKMSAVIAGIMMPVLLMITLTPIMIRWIRMFAEV